MSGERLQPKRPGSPQCRTLVRASPLARITLRARMHKGDPTLKQLKYLSLAVFVYALFYALSQTTTAVINNGYYAYLIR